MPQMAPISWLMLFMIFTGVFILFNIMNFFIIFYSPPMNNRNETNYYKSMNWKW